jgi:lipopolysaccharide export system permease protein
MKILDKYVAKNFLIGYCVAFCVLLGLRVIIDLFVNLDEFTEQYSQIGTLSVVKNILTYYMLNSTLYFRDFAGMITVVAAAFSLGRMIRSNELVAVMASGISLKRIITPIIFLALILTTVFVIDQEFLIPYFGEKLVRSHDDIQGQEQYRVYFVSDGKGSLICSQKFNYNTATLHNLTIITRQKIKRDDAVIWKTTGRIDARSAVYDPNNSRWVLEDGWFIGNDSGKGIQAMDYYITDVTPWDIPFRLEAQNKTLLSFSQLAALAKQGTKIKDLAQLYSQKHFRITEPIINLVMLMISLPILVCRDPKSMKSAVMISFAITGLCLITNFVCKLLATEDVFNIMPELWAWLPVFIFLPIAFIELDSMKT